jgi:hypothetical protein
LSRKLRAASAPRPSDAERLARDRERDLQLLERADAAARAGRFSAPVPHGHLDLRRVEAVVDPPVRGHARAQARRELLLGIGRDDAEPHVVEP